MKYLTVRHATRYRYAEPAAFGPHRLMVRPRDSHDLRLVDAELTLSPPGDVRWMHDVFGNSVALVEFNQTATELFIESILHLESYGLPRPAVSIAPEAQNYPFVYSAGDRSDLGRLVERHYPDPQGLVDAWAKRFFPGDPMPTYDLLAKLNSAIRNEFAYNARYEEGTQSPIETLEKKSGTCRDFALLFMEASAPASSPAICTIPRSTARKAAFRAPARRMRGPMSICPAPAGSNTTRPMG
jgi:transglutaminase-like putative cysteine protease